MEKTDNKMKKCISNLQEHYKNIRTGRANPTILEKIFIIYYGVKTQISQIANISITDPRIILIKPWDIKTLSDIEKAILKSDIGLSPNNDGTAIKIIFPPLSEERRNEIAKEVRKLGEEAKVSIRSIRRNEIDQIKLKKKKGETSEDEIKSFENKIQKLTNKYIDEIESIVIKKEKKISTV
ncbi:MAG: ribosome recycling factor [Clostridiales bacterium]|nr:ribosome recycling factor [Clostridiales bacterium]